MPRKRTGIGPRRKTCATAVVAAIAAEAAAAARKKGAATQAAKAAISQDRNQLLKKIHFLLEDMEPSQLQRILLETVSQLHLQIHWILKLASTRILIGM